MSADYLFMQDKLYDVRYDTGDKVIQCGRHNDIFKLWLQWRAKVNFSDYTEAPSCGGRVNYQMQGSFAPCQREKNIGRQPYRHSCPPVAYLSNIVSIFQLRFLILIASSFAK